MSKMEQLSAKDAGLIVRQLLAEGLSASHDELEALQFAAGRYGSRLIEESPEYQDAWRALAKREVSRGSTDTVVGPARRVPSDEAIDRMYAHLSEHSRAYMFSDPEGRNCGNR